MVAAADNGRAAPGRLSENRIARGRKHKGRKSSKAWQGSNHRAPKSHLKEKTQKKIRRNGHQTSARRRCGAASQSKRQGKMRGAHNIRHYGKMATGGKNMGISINNSGGLW